MNPRRTRKRARRSTRLPQRSVQQTSTILGVSTGSRVPRAGFLAHNITGVPQSTRQTLSWSFPAQFLCPPSAMSTPLQIRLNSLYDPDVSLGGSSATGFAKLMQFYSKYWVIGARVKIKFVNSNTTGDQPAVHPILSGVTITTDNTPLTTPQLAISGGMCDYDSIGSNPDHRVYTLGVDIGKYVDKPDILDDPAFGGTASSNPAQAVVAQLWVYNFSVVGHYVSYVAEVEFDSVFTDPIPFT